MNPLILIAALVASMPAGAVPTSAPTTIRTALHRNRILLLAALQDWQDYLSRVRLPLRDKFAASLLPLKEAAATARTDADISGAEQRLEAWKQTLMNELHPFTGHSAVSPQRQKSWDDLSGRIHIAATGISPDRLFDNSGWYRSAPVSQGTPGSTSSSDRVETVPVKGFVTRAVPSPLEPTAEDQARFARVAELLRERGASQRVVALTIQEALRQHVDPLLVLAVIQHESSFRAGVVSQVGARGLMQIMPSTGQDLGVRDPDQLFRPETNIRAGVCYLKNLWARFSDYSFTELARINPFEHSGVQQAVAAYNAGAGAVKKYRAVPPYRQTRNYVARVLRTYMELLDVFHNDSPPADFASLRPGKRGRSA